jgi:hypothetical protein
MNIGKSENKLPVWFWCIAILGLAWNIFGVVQFVASTGGSVGSMMSQGLTQQQAELYANLPIWMTLAFGVGVFGGVIGCAMLFLRKRISVSIFLLSLISYIVLYVGDITEGVFAVFGIKQVIVLSTVVLIAVALLWLAYYFKKLGKLV